MRFFFDRNTSPRLARMLDAFDADHTIRHHDDDTRFERTTPDAEWLAALAGDDEPWVIVSGDGKILSNKAESVLLERTGFRYFYLAPAWLRMRIHEQAWKLVRVWPAVTEAAANVRGRVFEVSGGRSLKVRRVG